MSTFTFSVRRRDLAWGVALIVLLSAIWVARGDVADAGVAPPGDGIAVVYVAVGTGFPDSLGVGPGAGANGAPIIIVPTNPPMNAATEAELIRLDPRTVIIVGGISVISAAMETELNSLLSNAVITRIGGANRYETNAMFSAATFPIEGWVSVPAYAFTANQPASDIVAIGNQANNGSDGFLFAPIQLPHGAEILEFKAGVNDAAGGAIQVQLIRVNNSAVSGPVAVTEISVGTSGFMTLSDTLMVPGTEIVDNETYAYFVQANTVNDGNTQIVNAMVHYRLGVSTG